MPACCIFYLTEYFGGCSEKTLPKQRLAISSKTFFSKNIAHMKVKFGHFVQLVVLTDRYNQLQNVETLDLENTLSY